MCSSLADFTLGALCKLCHRVCKPLSLNDRSSETIKLVHGGEEGMRQGPGVAATEDYEGKPASLGWRNAKPCFYAHNAAEVRQ